MSEGLIAGTIVILLLLLFLVLFIDEYQRRRKQHLKEKMDFQKELLRTQLEIQEQTLSNISQEIHDNIGQTLSLAKLNLNTLDLDNRDDKLANTRELVSKAISDLRSLSKTLNAETIVSAGLLKAIEYELLQVGKTGAFKTEFDCSGTTSRLSPQKELILFRIVQEGLNNIIKHSGAKSIKVEAKFEYNILNLTIIDNGIGFIFTEVSDSMENGSGLRNMKNRASLIGGSLEIESRPNLGTKIIIITPINEL